MMIGVQMLKKEIFMIERLNVNMERAGNDLYFTGGTIAFDKKMKVLSKYRKELPIYEL